MGPPIPGYPRGNKDPRTAPDSDPPTIRPKQRTLNDEDKATVKAFHAGNGQIGITIGSGTLIAAITSGLTWLATHQGAAPQDCASKAELAAVDKKVETISTNMGALAAKLNSDGDRAHNDLEMVKLRLEVIKTALAK